MKKYNIEIENYLTSVQSKADKIVDKFVVGFFVMGLCFAPLFQTWEFSLVVGGLSVLLYALSKFVPNKMLSRQIISSVFALFVLQFIGQSHGMAEFHFFFFINAAILIIYQDWRIMIPYTLLAIAHHSLFFYLQILGYEGMDNFFITYTQVDFKVLFFHYLFVILMAVIAAWWAIIFRNQSIKMIVAQAEINDKNNELAQSEEELRQNLEEIKTIQERLIATQAEERKANEIFKALFEYSSNAHLLFDQNGIMTCNKATLEMLGYDSLEQLRNIHPAQLSPQYQPDGRLSTEKSVEMDEIARKNGFHKFEWIHRKANGTDFPVEVTLKPIQMGTLNPILVVWHDLTEQKAAQQEILEQKAQLQRIFDGVPGMIYQFQMTPQGQFSFPLVSNGSEVICGLQAQEIMDDAYSISSRIHPQDIPDFQKGILESAQNLKNWHMDIRMLNNENQYIWIRGNSKPVRLPNGNILWSGIIQEVTHLKELEIELKTNEEKLQSIFNEIQEVIWSISLPDKKTSFITPSVEKIYETSMQEWLDDYTLWEKLIHPEDKTIVDDIFDSLRKTGYSNSEYRIVTPKGNIKWINNKAKIILNDKQEPIRIDGIVSDITRRKELQKTIERQNQELQESLEQVITLRQKSENARLMTEKLLEDIKASINYALRIQNAIIPKVEQLQEHMDCFVFFRPRDIVSGDFYWFADKGSTKILAVGDCTGHGVSGAFLTMIGNNILNQIVHDKEIHQPHLILDQMPILLGQILQHAQNKVADGMDIGIISLEKIQDNTQITFAGAVNPLYCMPLDNKNQELIEFKANKLPIDGNIRADFYYTPHKIWIGKNPPTENYSLVTQSCMLYLCSDGYQDQFGGANERKFMSKNFKKYLQEIAQFDTPTQAQHIAQTHDTWRGEQKQTDDILVVGIRI